MLHAISQTNRRSATPNQKSSSLFSIGPCLCSLVATFTSAVWVNLLNIVSIEGAIGLGALIGVGYLVSTCMNIVINPNLLRPFSYTAINAPYFIAASLISCTILVAMG